MLKTILVIHPHLDIKGGSERLTKILVEELVKMGIDVHLISGFIDSEWFNSSEINYYSLKNVGDVVSYVSDIVSEIKPEASLVTISESIYAYAAKTGYSDTTTGMYIHFPLDEEISEKNVREYSAKYRYPHLVPKYLKYVDVSMANSKRTALAVEFLWGFRPEVVYPCIDRKFFEVEPEISSTRSNTILYIGRFTPLKRHDFLLLALKIIRQEVPDARLILAGFVDPRHREYFEEVKAMADELGDVEVLSSPPEKKLVDLYREAKVYAHPRIGEHFGLAPIEAMSQATPIVIRSPSGLEEVISDGDGGFIAGSDYDMVKKITRILRMDRDEYQKLQRRALAKAKNFTPNRYAERVVEVLMRYSRGKSSY